ncbi:hypothetical protein Ancab_025025 [Ancistrocladus abbreviatus]
MIENIFTITLSNPLKKHLEDQNGHPGEDLCHSIEGFEQCREMVKKIIHSRFDKEYKERGILLRTSSSAFSVSSTAVSKGKNVSRTIIICRIIAGRMTNVVDKTSEGEYDTLKKEGFGPNLKYLIVKNPNAELPCFVSALTRGQS